MGSGGGAQSSAEVPDYMKYAHRDWLYSNELENNRVAYNINMLLNTGMASSANPFVPSTYLFNPLRNPGSSSGSSGASPDPHSESPIGEAIAAATRLKDDIDDIDVLEDWEDAVFKAVGMVDTQWIFHDADILYDNIANAMANVITTSITKARTLNRDSRDEALADLSTVVNWAVTKITSILDDADTDALAAAQAAMADTSVTTAITQYDTDQAGTHLRGVGRFAAGMADVNAVQSSAFVVGLALLEKKHQDDVNKFSADLKLKIFTDTYNAYVSNLVQMAMKYPDSFTQILNQYLDSFKTTFLGYMQTWGTRYVASGNARDAMLIAGTDQINNLNWQKIQGRQAEVSMDVETNKLWIAATNDYYDDRLHMNEMNARWNFELYAYAGNLLASGPGGTTVTKSASMSRGQKVMSGMMAGASVGSLVPGAGTLTGMVVGGLIGGIGGLVS